MRVVFPAEVHTLLTEGEQPVIGDGHSMCVTSEIPEHLERATQGGLGVDYPILAVQTAQELGKLFRVGQYQSRAGTAESLALIETFQSGEELAAKNAAQHFHRQKEWISRRDPVGVLG